VRRSLAHRRQGEGIGHGHQAAARQPDDQAPLHGRDRCERLMAPGNPYPRSILFVAAHRTQMFAPAWASEAEAVIFDLEDSVPPDQKAAGRAAISSLAPPAGWTRPILVRLNAVGSADFDADIRATVGAPVTGVMIPKVEHASQVQMADKA